MIRIITSRALSALRAEAAKVPGLQARRDELESRLNERPAASERSRDDEVRQVIGALGLFAGVKALGEEHDEAIVRLLRWRWGR